MARLTAIETELAARDATEEATERARAAREVADNKARENREAIAAKAEAETTFRAFAAAAAEVIKITLHPIERVIIMLRCSSSVRTPP